MKNLIASLPVLALDLCGIVGAALVSYGASLVYKPAGFIVAGALLLGACLFLSRAE